jgi:hypothetical protein
VVATDGDVPGGKLAGDEVEEFGVLDDEIGGFAGKRLVDAAAKEIGGDGLGFHGG